MRIGAFGGVYANPFAMRAVLDDARARGCEQLLCLGDLGGYGAACDDVWPLLLEAGVTCLAGNYDIAIGRGDPDCGCGYTSDRDNHFAQVMYDHTLRSTSRDFAAWMAELPLELRFDAEGVDVHAVHGSPLAVNDFFWGSLSAEEKAWRAEASGADVLLCTHTGIPWIEQVGPTLVVNVGAIGRPANDGRREVWYATVDVEDGVARAELHAVAYDWRAQAASMRAAGLPEAFVETVETGWWTTCLEVVPPAERARGRYHVYREALPAPAVVADGAGWADEPEVEEDGLPVVSLFGTPLFPPRLWVYTNFHCNLACGYCVVASSPAARKRQLPLERALALFAEAEEEGFTELYLTGGEPFVHPDLPAIVEAACDRFASVVVLTNAMLFTGRRREELARLAARPNLVLQSSLDSATPAGHDRWRGEGSWAKALDGLHHAASLGLPLRVAMTETEDTRGEGDALRALLDGVAEVAVRPLVARGFSADGMAVSDGVVVPELTVTTDGVHWHPLGGDVDASPDFLVAPGEVPLARAKELVVRRFLELRQADGTLPAAFQCAI